MITRVETNTNFNYYKRGQSFKASASFANKSVNTAYKSIDVNSADFIKYVYNKIRYMCMSSFEINVESGKIMDIVNSNEPYIFIMNHTRKQPKDINGAMFFNSLLYREYIYQNKAGNCPRSKVFAGEGFLKRSKMPEELENYKNHKFHRCHIFYSDARSSQQKARIEKNHEYIRKFVPQGKSFDSFTQKDINLI